MTSIYLALNDILNNKEKTIHEVIKEHFSSHYRQRTNGQWEDLDGFIAHAKKLREIVLSAEIKVFEELRNGNLYADRHRVHVKKHDGSEVTQEVYLFAETDPSGKFLRIEETTLMLEGSESDRNIGSVK